MHRVTSRHADSGENHDAVIRAIAAVQDAIRKYEEHPTKEQGEVIQQALYVLWMLVEEPLSEVARGWRRGGMYQDMRNSPSFAEQDSIRALAMSLFLFIIPALHKLKVDPEQDVVGLMKTIAQRGMSRENKRIYQPPHQRPSKDEPQADDLSDTKLYPLPFTDDHRLWVRDDQTQERIEPVDPKTIDVEQQLIQRCHNQTLLAALALYWQTKLTADSKTIVQARLLTNPPLSYRDVVKQLRPGWTPAAARKRYERILEDARRWLREHDTDV